mmetsp:Transcript_6333/g.7344  ORF Transcript_6333/g.7344 Transcript_6333/m.7344 type:complete len:161 (+) Transcript_6333:38-520(+)
MADNNNNNDKKQYRWKNPPRISHEDRILNEYYGVINNNNNNKRKGVLPTVTRLLHHHNPPVRVAVVTSGIYAEYPWNMNSHSVTRSGNKYRGVDLPQRVTINLGLPMEVIGKILCYLGPTPTDYYGFMDLVYSRELMDYIDSCPTLPWFERDTSMDVEEV